MKYKATKHAANRARLRFGIRPSDFEGWVNDLMRDAKYVSANGDSKLIYEADGKQIVVDDKANYIITIHSELNTDFLNKALEREASRIKRETTRSIRVMEKKMAEHYNELAEHMTNYARACNPNTRDIIRGKSVNVRREIESIESEIKRIKDDLKAKLGTIELIKD